MVKTPVALHIFNRPDHTVRVLDVLREVKPRLLIVHADGPRPHVVGEVEKCQQVRALIDTIDWDCEVIRNFSTSNLGSFTRNSTGLNFTFRRVEEAIILEDDCLPHPSFFQFCEELLELYRHDSRISVIGGFSNLKRRDANYSYFFSRYAMTWGWATWRRTWNLVDLAMRSWPDLKESGLNGIIPERWIRREWLKLFNAIYDGKMRNAWDYQLQLASWTNNMLSVVPNVSLIQNIGYGLDATHTHCVKSANSNVIPSQMEFPIMHPKHFIRDVYADRYIERTHFERTAFKLLVQNARNVLKQLKHLGVSNG
jgi:hypothetical protein